MNLLTLSDLCPDDEGATRFLQARGVIHQARVCSNGHPMNLSFGSQQRWRCRIRGCREERGLRTSNWLQGSRLSIRKIVLFVYAWSYEMTSIDFCQRELGIEASSVIDWNNYLREVCAYYLISNPTTIGGPGLTVELDESLFVRRKDNVGRLLPRQWVFGGICRETKDCFLYSVPDRSAATLVPIICEAVLPGSIVMTDEWRAYRQLRDFFDHRTVNHSYNFVNPLSGAHTQHVERMWRAAKRRNKRQNGTRRALLDSYLCEFMWRQKLGDNNPFDTILTHIAQFWPPV